MRAVDDMDKTADEWELAAFGVGRTARSGIGSNVPYIREHVVADRFSVCRSAVGSLLVIVSLSDESPVSFLSRILLLV